MFFIYIFACIICFIAGFIGFPFYCTRAKHLVVIFTDPETEEIVHILTPTDVKLIEKEKNN